MPQDWETPKWILPITIPMLDDELKVADMIDSESSSIELEDSDYSVSIDTVMIPAPPNEGSISIDENYFSRFYLRNNTRNSTICFASTFVHIFDISSTGNFLKMLTLLQSPDYTL